MRTTCHSFAQASPYLHPPGPPSYFQCVLTLACPYDDASGIEDAAPANEKGKEKENDETTSKDHSPKTFLSRQQATGKKAAKDEAAEHALKFLAGHKVANAEKALQSMNIEWNQTLKYHETFEKGDENQLLEFKAGKQPVPQPFAAFRKMFTGVTAPPMGKYLCAFHNALQCNGGNARICYGVHDAGGIVCGVVFDDPQRQKDDVRKLVDDHVKGFYPALTGKDWSLEFWTVRDAPLDQPTAVVYVVIVSAHVLTRHPSAVELFWWREEAWMRLEGSVARFTPQQIEKHYRRKAYSEMEELLAAQKYK